MKPKQNARILCAVDFDVYSLAALDLARDLAGDIGGTLYVLHVVPAVASSVIFAPLMVEGARHFARIRLEEIAREALSGVDYRLILRTGFPADQIIAAAAELDVKMVVLATHGGRPISRVAVGTVAEQVIRESPCPVVTISGVTPHESANSRAMASAGG